MNNSLRRAVALSFSFLASSAWVQAHPGHDGHDLTWDFSHLAAHPVATVGCFSIVVAIGVLGWFARRRSTRSSGAQLPR